MFERNYLDKIDEDEYEKICNDDEFDFDPEAHFKRTKINDDEILPDDKQDFPNFKNPEINCFENFNNELSQDAMDKAKSRVLIKHRENHGYVTLRTKARIIRKKCFLRDNHLYLEPP